MGIFDAWTGNSLSGAADKNFAQYQQYQTDATNSLNQGRKDSADAFNSGIAAYSPLADLGKRYSAAGGLGLDALGVNGAAGNARAVDAYHAAPGYQFATSQALDAATRAGNAMGATGNTIDEVTKRAAGYANQDYGNWLGALGGYAQQGTQATGAAAAGQAAGYNNLGGMYYQSGNDQANIFGNATSGITNSNMQAANAATQASGNMWKGIFDTIGSVAGGGKKAAA
jgi:hypothetical protein